MVRKFKFGYKFENMQIIIIEDEAKIIRQMFADYLTGLSTSKIAKKLNGQAIRYNQDGSDWSRSNVSYVFKDKAYLGDDDYPQIIDEKTFDAVQKLTGKNVHRIPEEEQAHAEIFKEKTRCSVCGGVIARRSMVKGQKDRVLMKCTNKECKCSQTTITLIQLEEFIKKLFGMIADDLGLMDSEIQEQDELKQNENITDITSTLRMNMHNPTKTSDEIMKEIIDVASARFDECTTSMNEKVTDRLKEQIHNSASESRIGANSIDEVIQRIILAPDKMVTIRFKNGKEFSERMA